MKPEIKLIDKAFYRLERCCESSSNWNRYMDLHREEERGHRKFCPDGTKCGLTVAQSCRLFAVKQIFERFVPAHSGESIFTPHARDYFHIRGSVFASVAMADEQAKRILAEFNESEMVEWLAKVDYAELNKDPRAVAA